MLSVGLSVSNLKVALIGKCNALLSEPVPESENSVLDPNAKKFLIFAHNLQTLKSIPLPLLIQLPDSLLEGVHCLLLAAK